MAIDINISCTRFFLASNPEWSGTWAQSTPDQRRIADESLRQDFGLTTTTLVDFNSSVAPSYVYPPGHPCYDTTKMSTSGNSGYNNSQVVLEDGINGTNKYAVNGILPGFGVHNFDITNKGLLIALVVILLGSAIVYRITR
jgi:hypothetical protein